MCVCSKDDKMSNLVQLTIIVRSPYFKKQMQIGGIVLKNPTILITSKSQWM